MLPFFIMKITKKIQERLDHPVNSFNFDAIEYQFNFVHELVHLKTKIHIYFNIDQKEDSTLGEISYELLDHIEYRGAIDLYFSLLKNRAIESLDRITNKEFDYYLRDDVKVGVFEFYDNKFYDVLGIGEAILKFIKPKENGPEPLMKSDLPDRFFTISFSEQIEYFEELLARYVYGHVRYSKLEIELEDALDNSIIITVSGRESGLEELVSKACLLELCVSKVEFRYLGS